MNAVETVEIVKNNYEIPIYTAIKIKNVYKLEGYNGEVYCLKVIHYEYGHFLFILEAIKHLIKNGFKNILEIITTKDGKDYINYGKDFAYVTRWANVRECNYDNPIDVILATSTLANLHRKSEDFLVTNEMKPRNYWLKWIENFETRKNEIFDFQNRSERKNEFDYKYLKLIYGEAERADKAIQNLKKSDYKEKMVEEMKKNGYCHHDYAHHNVLINKNSEVVVIDFDYCILDTHLHDIASLLLRKMKHGKWDLDNAINILEVYSAINPIKQSDIPVLAAFMEFPQDFWQLGIQYYWEKQPWGEEFFINKLNKIILDMEEKQEFIEVFRKQKFGGNG